MTVPRHTLHIVSGKGGTGKTTIAAALACALATAGRRVLLCEVEGRQGLSQLFRVNELTGSSEERLLLTPTGGEVYGLAVDPEDALLEYLSTFYKLGLAGKALDKFGLIDFATSIAPGLRDVLLTGKVYEAVRRQQKGLPTAYDAVVLDAPPTGRIAKFLNVHVAVAELARGGPIHSQADSIMRVLRSAQTVVHFVTLLEDMPVTETAEAVTEMAPTKIKVGDIIANMVTPSPLTEAQLAAATAGRTKIKVGQLTAAQNSALSVEFSDAARRITHQRACHERLRRIGLPVYDVPFDPDGIDPDSLHEIAETLTAQLAGEFA